MNEQTAIDLASEHCITVTTDDVGKIAVAFKVGCYTISRAKGARKWKVSEGGYLTFCTPTGGDLRLTRGNAIKFAVERILKDRELDNVRK